MTSLSGVTTKTLGLPQLNEGLKAVNAFIRPMNSGIAADQSEHSQTTMGMKASKGFKHSLPVPTQAIARRLEGFTALSCDCSTKTLPRCRPVRDGFSSSTSGTAADKKRAPHGASLNEPSDL